MLFRKKAKDEPPGKKLWETYFKELLKKNLQKAMAALNKLKELEPENSQVHLKTGDVLQRLGDVSGAIDAYSEAASCLVNDAHQEKAVAIYKIILRLDPDNSDTQRKMEEVVEYLESLGTKGSPAVSEGIEEMPIHETRPAPEPEAGAAETRPAPEAEASAAETQPAPEAEAEAWPSVEAEPEAETVEAQPEAEAVAEGEAAWSSEETEVEAAEAQPEAEPEAEAVAEGEAAWPSVEAEPEAETVEAQPEAEPQPVAEEPADETTEEPATILSALGEEETENLFNKALHRSFTYGETVVEEGEPGDSMFIIKNGSARVVSNILGKDIELATLKEGDMFGEMVFLSGRPRTASVIAEGDLEVLDISGELLQEVVENNPEVQNRIAEFFYSRVKDTIQKAKGR